MPKYQVRVEAVASLRVYDFIFVDAASPEHASQIAVQQAEQAANWDPIPSTLEDIREVFIQAVTLDDE